MIARIKPKGLLAAAVVVALVAAAFAFTGGGSTKTVTAYFSEAISVYKGSDVDVMGVRIGSVKAVVPDGDRVRVEIEYDGKYKLPADVKAAVITPTLVADRFVQLAPAYTGGAAMKDGGEIPLDRTAVPLELDKIYSSLAQLTKTLAHELAHIALHAPDVRPDGMTRDTAEVEAESVAYIVTAAHGLSADDYSVPYETGWAGGDVERIASTANRVLATSRTILRSAPPPRATAPETTFTLDRPLAPAQDRSVEPVGPARAVGR